jgi:AraC-like DNA-binding protein
MLFRRHQPAPPLAALVEDMWLYEHYESPGAQERILPSGTFEMVFNLRSDALRVYDPSRPEHVRCLAGAIVSGPYDRYFVSDAAQEVSLIGVHFKPGGIFPFLRWPAGDLEGSHIDLSELWGTAAAAGLRDQLAHSAPAQKLALIEQALLARIVRPSGPHPAVAQALRCVADRNGACRTGELARRAGLSERRFIEVFRAEVGVTPKLFSRITRFQHVLAVVDRSPRIDWADVAAAAGYFDQSHLIRDFVAFSGLGPAAYARRLKDLRHRGAHVKRHHLPCSA